jgi:hypothetical protein
MGNEVTHAAFLKLTMWQKALESPEFPHDRRPQVVEAMLRFMDAIEPVQRTEMALDMSLVTVRTEDSAA